MNEKTSNILVPLSLIAIVLSLGFSSLDRYNVTWDEALGDFFFGQRYLAFFTSFDPAYLEFDSNPFPPDHQPNLEFSPFRGRPWEYSPVANTLAAATSELLASRLHLVDPFDGFHAVNLILASAFLWLFYRFLVQHAGPVVALSASLLLMSMPRVVFHMLANIKDFPHLVLFGAAVIVWFDQAYCKGSKRGLFGAAVLWGLALGTRPNALFLPVIPLLVSIFGNRSPNFSWRGRSLGCWWPSAAAVLAGLSTWFASWPYLWSDPIGRLTLHFDFLLGRGAHTRDESLAPVLQALGLTTPEPVLGLALLGLVVAFHRSRKRDPLAVLLCAWCAAVLCRFIAPGMINYDGVRHFLELLPALCALAGIGLSTIFDTLRNWIPSRSQQLALALTLVSIAVSPGAFGVIRSHPFQSAYWNSIAGGLPGARAAGLPQAGDYWGSSYRLGLEWLDRNAEENAYLVVPVVEHAVRLVASERLRPDLTLLPVTTPLTPRIDDDRLAKTRAIAQHQTVYAMFVFRRDWLNQVMIDCLDDLVPIARWDLDGEPILSIYRYRIDGPTETIRGLESK